MKKLSVETHYWTAPVFSGELLASDAITYTRGPSEPKDRLEETRAHINELEERIAKLEDVVFILTGRKSSVPPAPEMSQAAKQAYSSHNRGCAISWSLGKRTDCTCPVKP